VLAAALLIFALVALAALGSARGGCHDPYTQPNDRGEYHQVQDCEYNGIALLVLDASSVFHRYHDDVNAIATAVIAAFTIVLAIVTGREVRLTRIVAESGEKAAQAAKATADALPAIERAYLFVEVDCNFLPIMREPYHAWVHRSEDVPAVGLKVTYRMVNHGKTPAELGAILATGEVAEWFPERPERNVAPVYTRETAVLRSGDAFTGEKDDPLEHVYYPLSGEQSRGCRAR